MKSTSGHFSFHGFTMSVIAGSCLIGFVLSIVLIGATLEENPPSSLGEFLNIIGHLLLLFSLSSLIAALYSFLLSALPFAATMGLFGDSIHSSKLVSTFYGICMGCFLASTMLLLLGSNSHSLSTISIFPFILILGVLPGAVGGLTYWIVSKRDPKFMPNRAENQQINVNQNIATQVKDN